MTRTRRGRQVDSGALAAFAPLLAIVPAWLAVVGLAWLLVRPFATVEFWQLAALHAALGVLLFWRPVQRVLLTRLLGARLPDDREFGVIGPLWNDVARAAGEDPTSYVLCVCDSDELNAYACGGHLVAVSSYALETLPRAELSGVLAHELGHHLGFHTVALTLSHWLALPVVGVARAGFWLRNVAQAFSETIATRSPWLVLLGRTVATVMLVVSSVLRAGVVAAQALTNAFGKGSEFLADTRAVEFGYGRELSAALRRFVDDQHGADTDWRWRAQTFASHPPPRTRVARIDAQIRRLRTGTTHPSGRVDRP